MEERKPTSKPSFSRNSEGFEKKTSRLKKNIAETEDAFFKRLNALGYENGGLEKAASHWNGDHSELHAGKADRCRLCFRAKTKGSQTAFGTVKASSPVKIGLIKPGRQGVSMLPLFFPTSFVEEVAKLPLASVRLVITVSTPSAPKVEKAPAAVVAPAAPTASVTSSSKEEGVPSDPKLAEALKEKEEKGPIKGGHTDLNRSLVDRGLPPVYTDADETHHKGPDQQPADTAPAKLDPSSNAATPQGDAKSTKKVKGKKVKIKE